MKKSSPHSSRQPRVRQASRPSGTFATFEFTFCRPLIPLAVMTISTLTAFGANSSGGNRAHATAKSKAAANSHVTKEPTLTTHERAALVYDRLTFGPRPGEVENLEKTGTKGINAWIERQLAPEQIDDSQLEMKMRNMRSLRMSSTELLKTYVMPIDAAEKAGIPRDKFQNDEKLKEEYRAKIGEDNLPEHLVQETISAKLMRAIESNRQLEEVLTDFWFNHFNIEIGKNEDKYLIPVFERETIRKNIFGNFSDLLRAVAHSPAMLSYLDNNVSESPLDYSHPGQPPKPRNKGLNENYAREILELHTLGVEGGYTQEDVTQLARILTGWSTDEMKTDPHFKYKDKVHDKGEKLFLEQNFAAGHGEDEGDRALDLISHHPATAKFISLKLLHLFVGDNPPASLVQRVQGRFMATHGDLKAVYRTIFYSPEFWSQSTPNSKVKKPLFMVASGVRALGGEVQFKTAIPHVMQTLGEDLYRCVPPTGYVDRAENWVNSGALVTRLNFMLDLTSNHVMGVYVLLPRITQRPQSISELVDLEAATLLHRKLSDSTKQIILREMGSESFLMASGEVRPWTLAKMTGLILGSPDFQRR